MNEASLTLKDPRPLGVDPFDFAALAIGREPERYGLHSRHLNEQMVRVLQTIGYDVGFTRGSGQYLWDRKGARYLDLLSGWGVFALGRNHPDVSRALISVIEADLPNLVQMDVSVLSGLLAERLLKYTPWLDKAFFCNSGAEAVEAARPPAARASCSATMPSTG
jgi:ornithine--oxo-acid transaminase